MPANVWFERLRNVCLVLMRDGQRDCLQSLWLIYFRAMIHL
jgi:hypothetical protein